MTQLDVYIVIFCTPGAIVGLG